MLSKTLSVNEYNIKKLKKDKYAYSLKKSEKLYKIIIIKDFMWVICMYNNKKSKYNNKKIETLIFYLKFLLYHLIFV